MGTPWIDWCWKVFQRSWQRKQLYPNQGRIQKGCLAQEELFEVAQEALKCQLEIKVFSHWQDRTLLILFLRKLDLAPQCLKITASLKTGKPDRERKTGHSSGF